MNPEIGDQLHIREDVTSFASGRASLQLAVTGSGYREMAGAASLRSYVACFWARESSAPNDHALVVPDGCIDIVWIGEQEPLLAGPATLAIAVDVPPGSNIAGVRFRPGIAPHLLGVSASEILDRHVPLDLVVSRDVAGLIERTNGLFTAENKLRILGQLVASKVRSAPAKQDTVRVAVALLSGSPQLDVHTVAQTLSVTDRHLRRMFLADVGYGPKALQRVLRFQRVLSCLRSPARLLRLADIAHQNGYADQAHMTRDFVELAGVPPARLATPHLTS